MWDAELTENNSCEDGTDDSAKSSEKAVVLLLRLGLLRSHDEDGLGGNVCVVVFGHRLVLLY
jgi:hypothetical protein